MYENMGLENLHPLIWIYAYAPGGDALPTLLHPNFHVLYRNKALYFICIHAQTKKHATTKP